MSVDSTEDPVNTASEFEQDIDQWTKELEQPELIDPDADIGQPYATVDWDTTFTNQVLTTMTCHIDVAREAATMMNPKSILDKGQAALFQVIAEYVKEYDVLPTKDWVLQDVRRRFTNSKSRDGYLGHVHAVYDFGVPTHPQHCRKLINELAKASALKAHVNAVTSGKKPIGDSAQDYATELERIGSSASDLYDDMDFEAFTEWAEASSWEWMLENWIAGGAVHLISGDPKVGKTTLLLNMASHLMRGAEWYGIPSKKVPCLFLEFEPNPPRFLSGTLHAQATPEENAAIKNMWHFPRKLPPAVTAEWLKGYLKRIGEPCVVFIDSAASCFEALFPKATDWMNSRECVTRAVQPVAKVCQETGCSVVLIHHDNKSGDVSGSNHWLGAVDYVWRYAKADGGRELRCQAGRFLGNRPQPVAFTQEGVKLVLCPTRAQAETLEQRSEQEEILELLPVIPLPQQPTADQAMTVEQLATGLAVLPNTLQKRLRALVDDRKVHRQRFGSGAQQAYHYWRSE
jgi:AAA domain-containing protein